MTPNIGAVYTDPFSKTTGNEGSTQLLLEKENLSRIGTSTPMQKTHTMQ
jgi:hypothetical protein